MAPFVMSYYPDDPALEGIDVFLDDPTFADPSGGAFEGFFTLVVVLIVVGVVVSVILAVRRAGKLRDAGIDPLDPTTDLQIRYMQRTARTSAPGPGGLPVGAPPAPAVDPATPRRPVEERLAEIDRLYEAGTISTAERDTARARVLDTI